MPHECTTCGRTFEDGSKEMLSGCPDCGGNKFQFHPAGSSTPSRDAGPTSGDGEPDRSSPTNDPGPATDSDPSSPTGADPSVGIGADDESAPDPDGIDRDEDPDSSFTFGSTPSGTGESDADPPGDATDHPSEDDHVQPREDRAQASARSAVVSEDELPGSEDELPGSAPPSDDETPDAESGDDPDPADTERPDLSELREELNEQFESIKIHRRGEYELNLMELYDREERIIALEEDGRYAIDVPSSWRETDDDE